MTGLGEDDVDYLGFGLIQLPGRGEVYVRGQLCVGLCV